MNCSVAGDFIMKEGDKYYECAEVYVTVTLKFKKKKKNGTYPSMRVASREVKSTCCITTKIIKLLSIKYYVYVLKYI